VNIESCHAAIAQQFPQLDLSGFRPLGEGGGFYVFETDSGLAWRCLKQPAGEPGLDLEIRLLPELFNAVSLPIPRYEYISDRAIPPRCVGYRKIEGVPFTREQYAACRTERPLRQLAQFLTELHRFPVERAQAVGVPLHAPAQLCAEQSNERICEHVLPLLNERQRAWAEQIMQDIVNDQAMLDYAPVLIHGDLWAEHILFDPAGEELTGVIDFESALIGDPALDWTALWLDHGASTVERLVSMYRGVVNATLRRRIARLADYVPLNEILCGVLYDDRASWLSGWQRVSARVR
jgi:aminoglycoside 2''-phosphotransferase